MTELLITGNAMLLSIVVICLCTIAIWWCSEQLAHGTCDVGKRFKIAPGVRGATLDAVASSFPELCAVVFALLAGHFDAGVGVVAGSALFNILVIPALVAFVGGGVVVKSEVVKRDGLLYVFVVLAFVVLFYLSPAGEKEGTRVLSASIGFGSILLYIAYVVFLFVQSNKAASLDEVSVSEGEETTAIEPGWKSFARILVGMAGVGVACHFLVEYGLQLITDLGFSPAVAGVTVLAAATSLPDTLLSIFAAKRGDADGAIANAFASNTFDILICLGLPILVMGGLAMNWDDGWPILVCLLLSTVTAVFLMITDWKLTRFEACFKLLLYVAFCVAIFLGLL